MSIIDWLRGTRPKSSSERAWLMTQQLRINNDLWQSWTDAQGWTRYTRSTLLEKSLEEYIKAGKESLKVQPSIEQPKRENINPYFPTRKGRPI